MATTKAKAKAGKAVSKAATVKGPTKAQAKVTSKAATKAKAKPAKVTKAKPATSHTDVFGTVLTGGMKWGSGMAIDDSMIITHVADNNKRGASRERFAKYKVGRTVAQTLAIDGGPHRGDIRWDAGKGLITLAKAKGKPAKAGKGKAA